MELLVYIVGKGVKRMILDGSCMIYPNLIDLARLIYNKEKYKIG